jgi:transketolase
MGYEQTLEAIAEKNQNVVVMTAENRAAIRNLPQKLGGRFIDVGIAEQTMIGAAAGLALRGRIPICHSLATFLTLRAFEFIRTDVGIAGLPVKLVGGVPGFLSDGNGPTHQAIEDIALMRGIPNMQVVCPADEIELVQALPKIIESPSPVYVRYYAGKAAVEHTSDYVAILTYGFLLREAIKAKEILEASGKSVRVVNLRSLKPIDEEAIVRAAKETKLLVTFEDHFLTGGLYSIVGEIFLKRQLTASVLPVALEERWFKPALLADVLEHEGFTGDALAKRIQKQA